MHDDAVWNHVIRALQGSHETLQRPRRADASAPSRHAQIEVLERLSERTIAVLWQDATRCRYVDQIWTSCRARASGRCALTGAVIGRNDMVYKPRSRSLFPGNARAMILASVIASLPAARAVAR